MKLPSVTQAFLIHFAISVAVFCALVAVMVFSWLPGELFFMEGGWDGIKIIAPIDLVLGPALTLIFYRPWKKNVRFDMSFIVFLQVAALGYGVYTAHGQRTAAIVFAEHRFETVTYNEFKAAQRISRENHRHPKSIDELGGKMPLLVYAEPFKGDDHIKYMEEALNGDLELRERSDRYRPLDTLTTELDEFRQPAAASANDTVAGAVSGVIKEVPAASKLQTGELQVPIKTISATGILTLDPDTYEITGISRDG